VIGMEWSALASTTKGKVHGTSRTEVVMGGDLASPPTAVSDRTVKRHRVVYGAVILAVFGLGRGVSAILLHTSGPYIGPRANLVGADLSHRDLSGADLYEANRTDADLTDAHLTHATLTGVNLTGADLTNAHLSGTFMSGETSTGSVCERPPPRARGVPHRIHHR
jgi:hypothetical protein